MKASSRPQGEEGLEMLDRVKFREEEKRKMYVQPLDLEPGTETFSPTRKAYGLFDHGIIREPHGRTTTYAMISNGSWQPSTAEQVKSTGILGEANLPTVLVYDDLALQQKMELISDVLFEREPRSSMARAEALDPESRLFEPFEQEIIVKLKNIYGLLGGINIGNMTDKDNQSLQDVLIRTGSMPPDFGVIVQKETNGWLTFTADQQNLMLAMNDFQANFTELQRLKLPQPRIAAIGYGLVTKQANDGTMVEAWRVKKRPGYKLRIASTEEFALFSIREDPYTRFAERSQAFVTGVISCLLRKFVPIPDYVFNDRVALLGALLLLYTGSADIKVQSLFEATDIYMSALCLIGTGESLAYRLNPDTIESAVDRFVLEIALGWLFQRYKGTTSMATIYPGGKTYANKLVADFNIFMQPQLPGIGSGSAPYFLTSTNRYDKDIPFPMLVREDEWCEVHLLARPTNIKFATADVVMGKVPLGVASQVSNEEIWYRWRVTPDAEGVVLDRFMRHLIQWRWPWWHLINGATGSNVEMGDRYFMWLFNLLYTESTILKDGTLIRPGLGVLPWSEVAVRLNSRYEIEVVKVDTTTTGMQEPRPGAETEPPRPAPAAKSKEEVLLATQIPGPVTPVLPVTAQAPDALKAPPKPTEP